MTLKKRFHLAVGWLLLLAAIGAGLVLWSVRARGQTVAQAMLFTWPGDDGNVGTCAGLELRWSRNPVAGTDTLSWWNAATRFTGTYPVPKIAGTADSVIVVGLPSGAQLYANMRAFDEVPNWSGFSNMAAFQTPDFVPPGRIQDLRARP